jgi:hypothetical protein
MYKKLSWAFLALGALFLLGSCGGGIFGSGDSIPGTKIYTLTSRQLPDKPSTIEFVVDVDTAAKTELQSKLLSAYHEPDQLYIWMAVKQDQTFGYYGSTELKPIFRLSLDPAVTHYEAAFDLLKLSASISSGGYGFSWLEANSLFDEGNPADNMKGYYLFASDGYSYNSTGSSYDLEGPNSLLDLHTFSFPNRFPKGQGLSNYIEYPEPGLTHAGEWIPIIQGNGGVMSNLSTNELTSEDIITITYTTAADDPVKPKLNVNGIEYDETSCTNDPITGNPVTYPIFDNTLNLNKWDFQFRFVSGPVTPITGVDISATKGNWYGITVTQGKYYFWNQYLYRGQVTPLMSESFEGTPALTLTSDTSYFWDYNTYAYQPYDRGINNWSVGTPDPSSDRTTNVENLGLSTGQTLNLRGASAGTWGGYDPDRYDYVDITVGSAIASGSDLMLKFSQRSDMADGDWVQVWAVMDDGYTTYNFGYFNRWSSTVTNYWDSSIIDGWQRYSSTYSWVSGGTIAKLRFAFYSDGFSQGRGITIDDVQLSSLQ